MRINSFFDIRALVDVDIEGTRRGRLTRIVVDRCREYRSVRDGDKYAVIRDDHRAKQTYLTYDCP